LTHPTGYAVEAEHNLVKMPYVGKGR